MSDDKIIVNADQVMARKGGWVSYIDDRGTLRKARATKITVREEAVAALQDAETESTSPATAEPTVAEQIADSESTTQQAPSKVLEERKVASKGKKKAAKKASNGAAGLRTIGGKSFDLSKYEKSKAPGGGTSYNNGDEVASSLSGKDLDAVYRFASSKLKTDESELRKKYKHLNPGMQRMNLGNRLRKVLIPKAAR